jgi:5-deoxy-glucuronate isomerase
MPDLLVKPTGTRGKVHAITPESAGWGYVGFTLYRLEPGDVAEEVTGDREVILVLVEGQSHCPRRRPGLGRDGRRGWTSLKRPRRIACTSRTAATGGQSLPPPAPLPSARPPARAVTKPSALGPTGLTLTPRGKGTNTRHVNNIAMEALDVADSLLVTEVFTPAGNWSSYPSHRHDEDDFPEHDLSGGNLLHAAEPRAGLRHPAGLYRGRDPGRDDGG